MGKHNWRNETEDYPFDRHVRDSDTPLAWCVEIDGEVLFFPKSLCEIDEEAKEIEVPNWLAQEKELI